MCCFNFFEWVLFNCLLVLFVMLVFVLIGVWLYKYLG